MKLTEHIKIYRRGMAALWRLSRDEAAFRFLGAAVEGVTPYVPIWFSARLIDAIAAGRPAGTLALYAGLTVGLAFALGLLAAWFKKRMDVGNFEFSDNLAFSWSRKTMEMSYASVEDRDTALRRERAERETTMGYNFYTLRESTQSAILYLIQIVASVSLTAPFFALGSVAVWMKLALAAGVAAAVAWQMALYSLSAGQVRRLLSRVTDVNLRVGKLDELMGDYAYGKDIRLYGMGEGLVQKELALSMSWTREHNRVQLRAELLNALGRAADFVLRFGVYLVLIYASLRGEVSVGSIAQYVSCVTLLLSAAAGLLRSVTRLAVNDGYLKRLFAWFDIPNEMYRGTLTVEKRDDNEYDLEFRDVSFRYPHTDTWALRHVNFRFRVGEKLAIVGLNGSGKTTFIKLLTRLYDPTEGVILLNGVDIRKYDYEEYLSLFSLVFQDFRLFAVPLGQNVAAGTQVDRDRAEDCLMRAGLDPGSLPRGLDTCLYKDFDRDGVEISGGEAQKIALARALYRDAPFMVLDEPTAALDPVSEYEVYSRFNAIAGDRTAVYISHRLASCRFCDKIAVFRAGQIVQTGRHRELAEAEGLYRELWEAQAGYYI